VRKEQFGHVVERVITDSIADQIGIKKGDTIVCFNNEPFIDIVDYIYFSSKEKLTIDYMSTDGEKNKQNTCLHTKNSISANHFFVYTSKISRLIIMPKLTVR